MIIHAHEASEAIIRDILVGCPHPTAVISHREQAICTLSTANPADVVVIAGK
ncbi:MAG: hypothetical protein R3E08_09055 [Thiotrichaceae bacterium]